MCAQIGRGKKCRNSKCKNPNQVRHSTYIFARCSSCRYYKGNSRNKKNASDLGPYPKSISELEFYQLAWKTMPAGLNKAGGKSKPNVSYPLIRRTHLHKAIEHLKLKAESFCSTDRRLEIELQILTHSHTPITRIENAFPLTFSVRDHRSAWRCQNALLPPFTQDVKY